MKFACGSLAAATLALFAGTVAADPVDRAATADVYLKPTLKVGERLVDVYSKSTSIRGEGFEAHVSRYSGISEYTITAVTSEAIVADETDLADGQSGPPSVSVKFLKDGVTNCYLGKCVIDDQTSGLIFNSYVWGHAPTDVHAGSHWTVKVRKPWEIGPAGVEQVRVVSVDPVNGEITLVRHGSGEGPSSDELRLQKPGKPIELTARNGNKLEVSLVPGKATWDGYTTVRKGVIVGDEIVVTQQVKLLAKDGRTFAGELRSYTLLDLAQDAN